MEKRKQASGWDTLGYALYAFGGLGLELLLIMLEEGIYGTGLALWTDFQQRMHWCIVTILWGVMVYLLLRHMPKYTTSRIPKQDMLKGGILALIAITYTSITWQGCKPFIEFQALGTLDFLLQYSYYAMESALILLIVVFGQSAAAIWLKKDSSIPYGGILLALTWGLVHILTQGLETGLYAVVLSVLYGLFFMLMHKNIRLSYLGIALMFMI